MKLMHRLISNQETLKLLLISNHQKKIVCILFSLRKKILFGFLRRIYPNSAGLVNSRTGGVWNKSLEEAHSAQVKERSLLGHLICSKETQKKILEGIQRSCRGKSLFMVGSREMFSLRKRWCCVTAAKLATCLVRIALWLHPRRRILACL